MSETTACNNCDNCDCNAKAEAPPEYEIRTVHDFMKIPAESLDACLRDFASYIAFNHSLVNMFDALVTGALEDDELVPAEDRAELQRIIDGGSVINVDAFKWRDDGTEGCAGMTVSLYSEDEDGNQVLFDRINVGADGESSDNSQ